MAIAISVMVSPALSPTMLAPRMRPLPRATILMRPSRSAKRYVATLQETGFHVSRTEDHSDVLVEMVRQIQTKLLGAEIMAGLKKIDLPGVDFATGRKFAQAALEATRSGVLGYIVIASRKP